MHQKGYGSWFVCITVCMFVTLIFLRHLTARTATGETGREKVIRQQLVSRSHLPVCNMSHVYFTLWDKSTCTQTTGNQTCWYEGSTPAMNHLSNTTCSRPFIHSVLRWHTYKSSRPGSQYDVRTSVVSRASEWRWNRLEFYSSVVSWALASVQPIRLSKNLTSRMQFDWWKNTSSRDTHDARDAGGTSIILWTRPYIQPAASGYLSQHHNAHTGNCTGSVK